MQVTQLIHNATIINDGEKFHGYITVVNDIIDSVNHGDPLAEEFQNFTEVYDAHGYYLLPGVIDDQVHFRDPGLTHKADIFTESRAAVAGGVTSFMDMPNTVPQTVTCDAVKAKQERAAQVSLANYSFFIGATNDNLDELLKADYSEIPGVKLFLGASTGNMLVDNETALDNIFEKVKSIIAIHSEDEAIIAANRQKVREQYGDDAPIALHPEIRSREACVESTRRAIERAKKFGTRLHILHISTADEAKMLEYKPLNEKQITAEVCVHHLWFCDEDYERLGSRIKWNPAVKTGMDRYELCKALNDGRIDVVATDHAPHLLSEKMGGALKAASGGPLVQFSLPLMLEIADYGIFKHELVIEKMCHAPAKLFRIDRRGYLRSGYFADFSVVKPADEYTVTDDMVLSRCAWSPLTGTKLHNRVITTWVNGKKVYDNGQVADLPSAGMNLKFN
jgi:dihydroorotase